MVDVVLSHADKDRQKSVGQLVDVAKQFYGSSFSAEAYEHARQPLTDIHQLSHGFLTVFIGMRKHHVHHFANGSTCLLYTSRCV